MLLSGIYAAQFRSDLEDRTGVAIFTDDTFNCFHGGDASQLYQGTYRMHDHDRIVATVVLAQHAEEWVVDRDQFRLELTGKVSEGGTEVALQGLVNENPSRLISIKLRKLEDLPDTKSVG